MRVVGSSPWSEGREGVALPLLLVLLLALTLLGQGTLLLARREAAASKAFLHAVRSSLAARGGLIQGLRTPPDLSGLRLPGSVVSTGSGWVGDGVWSGGSLRWLGPELFFLQGEGRSRGWPGRRVYGSVGWSLDPVARVAGFRAGVELGGNLQIGPGAVVSSADPRGVPERWSPEECREFVGALDSIFPGGSIPFRGPLPPADPALGGSESDLPPLGLLSGEEFLFRAADTTSPPAPTSGPLPAPGCPGSGDPVFLGLRGDLEVGGGRACGLLVVDGDLRVRGDALLQGLVLVSGDLILEGAGSVEGMARVRGSLSVKDSATFRILGCPVLRALSWIPALRKPILLPGAYGFPVH